MFLKTWYRIHEARPPLWNRNDTQSDIECMSESYVLIREGNLLCGVLDKAHYGSTTYSLVHCCYELFGGDTAGKLLTCFGKVFTTFIQFRGFTLGVEDILLTPEASEPRAKLLKKSKKCGYEVIHKVFQQCDPNDHDSIKEAYMKAHMSPDDSYMKEIDLAYKGKVDTIQNTLVNLCFPGGLAKRFPYNNLQLMIQSGAKGSTVNSMQMSCLLGQQELEGRRPRLMPNGNSLPSFLPYDPNPNGGGFICGSFMTGLTPQEYFFHCMAGREGLVDTAVKTSRSGYLQRCLVKHLEGIIVNYDLTVRDSDGSVIQFQYGEDSLSIEKTQFLNDRQFSFLIDNYSIITSNKDEMDKIQSICHYDLVDKTIKKTKEWRLKHGKNKRTGPFINFCEHMGQSSDVQAMKFEERIKYMRDEWKKLNKDERKAFNKGKYKQRLPITAEFNADRFLGAISENLQDKIDKYIYDNSNCFSDSPRYSSQTSLKYSLNTEKFRELIYLKSLKSCITPGDGVGVLAAQSIGEPSTQMTLNTFHFAGRGDMNVTLGIPRLREILMVASPNIKTPSMEIPIYSHKEDHADKLKYLFTRTLLWDCLQDVQITQELVVSMDISKECSWRSTIRFKFLPEDEIKSKVNETLRLYEILAYVEAKFFKNLCISINKKYNQISSSSLLHASSVRDKSMRNYRNIRVDEDGGNDGIDQDDADDAMESGGSDGAKLLDKINDELEYVGEEEEKDEVGEQDESESDVEIDAEKPNDEVNNTGDETTDDEPSEKKEVEIKTLKRKTKKIDPTRINNVINISSMIESYKYDPENKEWCEIELKLDASKPRLDLYSIVQKEAKSFYIAKIEGIKRCFVNKSKVPSDKGCLKMVTEGINIKVSLFYT
jgi:DNA-directed RNA polymerase I subunit RPA1